MRGWVLLGVGPWAMLAVSLVSFEAMGQAASKAGKLRAAAAPAPAATTTTAADAPAATAAPTASTAGAATTATSTAPAASNSTPGASSTGAQPGEAQRITWSTPFTLERVSVSIGPEYGSNDLNLGLGFRGGYTIRQSVYFGVLADYWLGTSEEATVPGGGTIKASAHAWDVMADIGYDLAPSPTIVLRPFAAFGIYGAYGEACTSAPGGATTICANSKASKGAGAFGGQVLFDLNRINLGGELRLIIAGDTAALIAGRVGTTF